jgi:L-ribulose-5-phosphate 4-epimerase
MLLETLRREICEAARHLERHAMPSAPISISGINRASGFIAITPVIFPATERVPSHISLLDLNGGVIEGDLPPSPDAPTHLALYNSFKNIGGITHAHTRYATMFAQAGRPIPCFGTTHADHFHGEIPVTRAMRKPELETNVEYSTGLIILERFSRINPAEMPAALVMYHGPVTWGPTATAAVANSIALEDVARLAFGTLQLNPAQTPLPAILQDRHYSRAQGSSRP